MDRKIYIIDHWQHQDRETWGEIKEKQQSVARKEENKGVRKQGDERMNQGINEWNEK